MGPRPPGPSTPSAAEQAAQAHLAALRAAEEARRRAEEAARRAAEEARRAAEAARKAAEEARRKAEDAKKATEAAEAKADKSKLEADQKAAAEARQAEKAEEAKAQKAEAVADLKEKEQKLAESKLDDIRQRRPEKDPSDATRTAQAQVDGARKTVALLDAPAKGPQADPVGDAGGKTDQLLKKAQDAAQPVFEAQDRGGKPTAEQQQKYEKALNDWYSAAEHEIRLAGMQADAKGENAAAAMDKQAHRIVQAIDRGGVFNPKTLGAQIHEGNQALKAESPEVRRLQIERRGVEQEGQKQLGDARQAYQDADAAADRAEDYAKRFGKPSTDSQVTAKQDAEADAERLRGIANAAKTKVERLERVYGSQAPSDPAHPDKNRVGTVAADYDAQLADLHVEQANGAYQRALKGGKQDEIDRTYKSLQVALDGQRLARAVRNDEQAQLDLSDANAEVAAAKEAWNAERAKQPEARTVEQRGRGGSTQRTIEPDGYDRTFWLDYDRDKDRVKLIDGKYYLITPRGRGPETKEELNPVTARLWATREKQAAAQTNANAAAAERKLVTDDLFGDGKSGPKLDAGSWLDPKRQQQIGTELDAANRALASAKGQLGNPRPPGFIGPVAGIPPEQYGAAVQRQRVAQADANALQAMKDLRQAEIDRANGKDVSDDRLRELRYQARTASVKAQEARPEVSAEKEQEMRKELLPQARQKLKDQDAEITRLKEQGKSTKAADGRRKELELQVRDYETQLELLDAGRAALAAPDLYDKAAREVPGRGPFVRPQLSMFTEKRRGSEYGDTVTTDIYPDNYDPTWSITPGKDGMVNAKGLPRGLGPEDVEVKFADGNWQVTFKKDSEVLGRRQDLTTNYRVQEGTYKMHPSTAAYWDATNTDKSLGGGRLIRAQEARDEVVRALKDPGYHDVTPPPSTRLASPDPKTFDSPQAYTDWLVKQAKHSDQKADELQVPFDDKTMNKKDHPVEWGQYLTVRWDATRDRARVEGAMAAELRAVATAHPGDQKAVDEAARRIAARYADDLDAQEWLNEARKTVKTETPMQRDTASRLHETNLAQGKFLALQAQQKAAKEKNPNAATPFDQQLVQANEDLQKKRLALMGALGKEFDAEMKGKEVNTDNHGAALRTLSERYDVDPEVNGALVAEWMLRESQGPDEKGATGPDIQMRKLGVLLAAGPDPVVESLVKADPRGQKIISDYTAWGVGQVNKAAEGDSSGAIGDRLDKLRELTDPHKVSPFEAELLVTDPSMQKLLKDGTEQITKGYLSGDAFTDISAIADSAMRNAKLAGTVLPGQTKSDAPKLEHRGLPGLRETEVHGDTPQWLKGLAGGFADDYRVAGYVRFSVKEGGGSFLPLEIARQLQADEGKRGRAYEIVNTVNEAHDELEADLREPAEDFFEMAAKVVGPPAQWQPLLTKERQERANKDWAENPRDFAKEVDQKYKEIQEDPAAYSYLRSMQGIAWHNDRKTFDPLLGEHDKGSLLRTQLEEFNTDRNLHFAVGSSNFTNNEVFRIYQDAKINGHPFDPKLFMKPGAAPSAEPMAFTEALKMGGTYAGIGGVVGAIVFSKVNFGTGFAPAILPMMGEQVVRETFLFAGINGGFAALAGEDPSALKKYAVNTGITLAFTGGTVALWHKGLSNVMPSKEVQVKDALGNTTNMRVKDMFRIPVSQMALVFALPATIPAMQEFAINPLIDWALGESNAGKKGPNGEVLTDDWYKKMIRDYAPVVNIAGQVSVAASLSGAYSTGSAVLGYSPEGAHWKRAPFRLTSAPGKPSALQVMKTGFQANGLASTAKTAGGIFLLVGANVVINGAIFGGELNMPAGEQSLVHGGWGKASQVAMAGGSAMTAIGSLAGVSWMGPVGAGVFVVGAGAAIAFMAIDRARASSYMEGPTREYLYSAGFDRGFADIMADHDGNGISSTGRLVAYAKMRGEDPAELMERLQEIYRHAPNGKELVDNFITATHFVEPNEKGEFPKDLHNDVDFGKAREFGSWFTPSDEEMEVERKMEQAIERGGTAKERLDFVGDDRWVFDSGSVYATSMRGLDLWYRAFMPDRIELDKHIPDNLRRTTTAIGGEFPPAKDDPKQPDPSKPPAVDTPTQEPPKEHRRTRYVVQHGDDLWRIAGYDARIVNRIIDANPHRFHPDLIDSGVRGDPSALNPGDVLFMPEGYQPPERKYMVAGRGY